MKVSLFVTILYIGWRQKNEKCAPCNRDCRNLVRSAEVHSATFRGVNLTIQQLQPRGPGY
jgi:hypothetical protein